jgi:hypothetical protein
MLLKVREPAHPVRAPLSGNPHGATLCESRPGGRGLITCCTSPPRTGDTRPLLRITDMSVTDACISPLTAESRRLTARHRQLPYSYSFQAIVGHPRRHPSPPSRHPKVSNTVPLRSDRVTVRGSGSTRRPGRRDLENRASKNTARKKTEPGRQTHHRRGRTTSRGSNGGHPGESAPRQASSAGPSPTDSARSRAGRPRALRHDPREVVGRRRGRTAPLGPSEHRRRRRRKGRIPPAAGMSHAAAVSVRGPAAPLGGTASLCRPSSRTTPRPKVFGEAPCGRDAEIRRG